MNNMDFTIRKTYNVHMQFVAYDEYEQCDIDNISKLKSSKEREIFVTDSIMFNYIDFYKQEYIKNDIKKSVDVFWDLSLTYLDLPDNTIDFPTILYEKVEQCQKYTMLTKSCLKYIKVIECADDTVSPP
jgi:hypothetical protein